MPGYLSRATVPTEGTNELTKRLLENGAKFDDMSTWPEDVWQIEKGVFGYKYDYVYTPTWESPCGLLIKKHGQRWGSLWMEGEWKCAENDNPMFECPTPHKECPHRRNAPRGINCQFHRTDREWTKDGSCEQYYERRNRMFRKVREDALERYPGWNGMCVNLIERGTDVRQFMDYNVSKCISYKCASKQCVCRLGAARDLRKCNIFYDVYTEMSYTLGMVELCDRKLKKGLKVFDNNVAMTDAQIALKIWEHDKDNITLPAGFDRLNALSALETREHSTDTFFIRHFNRIGEKKDVRLTLEIRNIRIERREARDLLEDLQNVRDGIEVTHASDAETAAKAAKKQRIADAKVQKYAKRLASEWAHGHRNGPTNWFLQDEKKEFRDAVRAEAARITEKENAKKEKERRKAEQVTLFDL